MRIHGLPVSGGVEVRPKKKSWKKWWMKGGGGEWKKAGERRREHRERKLNRLDKFGTVR